MDESLQGMVEIVKLEIQARRTHNELRPRIKKTVDLNLKILAKEIPRIIRIYFRNRENLFQPPHIKG